jgi:hypothetical protein
MRLALLFFLLSGAAFGQTGLQRQIKAIAAHARKLAIAIFVADSSAALPC